MSHHIYKTKAFVIDSVDVDEANKLLTLFTVDLGLIFVSAQGVRVMQSKLRPSIQDLSFSKVALVRGKEYWRLTSAEKLISLYDKRIPLNVRQFMSGVLQFIKRLTTGEAKHEELFDMTSKLFTFCFENSKFFIVESLPVGPDGTSSGYVSAASRIEAITSIAQFRILEALGYGSDEKGFDDIRDLFVWNSVMIDSLAKDIERLEKVKSHIQKALENSHL